MTPLKTYKKILSFLIVVAIFVLIGIACRSQNTTVYTNLPQQYQTYTDDGYAVADAPYVPNQQPDWDDGNYYVFSQRDAYGNYSYRRVPKTQISYTINITKVQKLDSKRRDDIYGRLTKSNVTTTNNPTLNQKTDNMKRPPLVEQKSAPRTTPTPYTQQRTAPTAPPSSSSSVPTSKSGSMSRPPLTSSKKKP